MRIQYGTLVLATTGDLLKPAGAIRVNGEQVVDIAALFRASAASVHGRGNRTNTISFAGSRLFTSLREAERFVLLHEQDLADSATLYLTCGRGADTEVVSLPGAVFAGWQLVPRGLSILVEYTFRGGRFSSDAVTIPDEESIVKRGTEDLGSGADSGAVTFATAFAATPVVVATVRAPNSTGAAIAAVVHSESTTGFSFFLTGVTPDANHKLNWLAVAPNS